MDDEEKVGEGEGTEETPKEDELSDITMDGSDDDYPFIDEDSDNQYN